ncbi:MAG: Gx transporter family protein [Clostridia bacterium]|nr:Gx transporter family protein [Clostridia bacterium]
MKVKRLTELSLMTGISLSLFALEMLIPNPFPIPGIKLGLANIVTVFAIYRYSAKETLLVLLARILLSSMFSGSLTTLLYSLTGGLLCFSGMLLLRKWVNEKHMYISSVIGAILHNIGQISAAIAVTKTMAIISYLPFLLVSGCLAGAFTGLCAQMAAGRIRGRN